MWSQDGRILFIHKDRFIREILSRGLMGSSKRFDTFLRQLNYHGFRRCKVLPPALELQLLLQHQRQSRAPSNPSTSFQVHPVACSPARGAFPPSHPASLLVGDSGEFYLSAMEPALQRVRSPAAYVCYMCPLFIRDDPKGVYLCELRRRMTYPQAERMRAFLDGDVATLLRHTLQQQQQQQQPTLHAVAGQESQLLDALQPDPMRAAAPQPQADPLDLPSAPSTHVFLPLTSAPPSPPTVSAAAQETERTWSGGSLTPLLLPSTALVGGSASPPLQCEWEATVDGEEPELASCSVPPMLSFSPAATGAHARARAHNRPQDMPHEAESLLRKVRPSPLSRSFLSSIPPTTQPERSYPMGTLSAGFYLVPAAGPSTSSSSSSIAHTTGRLTGLHGDDALYAEIRSPSPHAGNGRHLSLSAIHRLEQEEQHFSDWLALCPPGAPSSLQLTAGHVLRDMQLPSYPSAAAQLGRDDALLLQQYV